MFPSDQFLGQYPGRPTHHAELRHHGRPVRRRGRAAAVRALIDALVTRPTPL